MTAVYNLKKREDQILARFAKSPPSFAVHLHPGHWTLNKDNNARTFLYTSPAVSILESIRAHRVPVDMLEMLDQANVSFYDGTSHAHLGCLIVEEHDHMSAVDPAASDPSSSENPKPKPQANPSQKRRIVLYPNGETLWADIGLFNVRNGNTWTDQQAIEFEAKILSVTTPPLCLDPDPVASRIATLAMSSTSLESPKRKHSIENDKRDNGTRKAEHDKFMNVMNPRSTRIFHGDFRQITWLEQNRRGERASSPSHRTPSPQASLAPTPTPPPPSLLGDEANSSQKKKSKKKKGDGPDSPMQVDAPSPGVSSKAKPHKNSVSQSAPPHISKKKQPQQSRRGTASSVEPSPAHPVLQLPPHTTNGQVSSVDSPQSMQASPNPAMGKKDETQSSLGIGVPPSTSHSPAPINQQIPSGPPKKRMKTETPQTGSVPLPGAGSQQGTPQQPYTPLVPHLSAPGQQPNAAQLGMHRYSASPVPTPVTNNQPTQQFHGQPAHNYGHLGLNVANGMMINNGAGIPGYNMAGMQQQQAQNMHSNMFTAPGQQQAVAQAGSPHSLPPSRPASQASIPMRNSPRPPAHMPLGGNNPGNLQVPQHDQQGARPASALGQQGMQPNPGMHQAANPMTAMSMDPVQMGFLQQMQAQQRMAFPGAQGMMQYPGFPMQMPGQPAWRVPTPGQIPMGVGRGQTPAQLQQQYAAVMQQRRNAMQAPPNPPR